MSMSADDGWCKHFDKEERACTIYEDRPRFCRVETETFGDMYGVEPEDMDDFCSACCREQIGDVYGRKRLVTVFTESGVFYGPSLDVAASYCLYNHIVLQVRIVVFLTDNSLLLLRVLLCFIKML